MSSIETWAAGGNSRDLKQMYTVKAMSNMCEHAQGLADVSAVPGPELVYTSRNGMHMTVAPQGAQIAQSARCLSS